MNKELDSVSGTVEAVSEKFNGSVKLNGTWYSYSRDFKGTKAQSGQSVSLSLEAWEAKGKSGYNIIAVSFEAATPPQRAAVSKSPAVIASPTAHAGRDFDAENRGKVRHGLMVALAPLVATGGLKLDEAKELIVDMTEFVMTGN